MMRPIDEIDYPRDADEWWALLEHHKENLRAIVEGFHPWYMRNHDHEISSPGAEAHRRSLERELGLREITESESPTARFDRCLAEKDRQLVKRQLVKLLNAAWWGLPESRDSRAVPGFFVLCNLCSEAAVLYSQEEIANWGED